MKRVERDFITLFNCLWYRDFPVSEAHAIAGRADWTIHLGLVIRQCATLLGARALFEQGGRTDAVIRYSDADTLSFVEWEWKRAHTDINEFSKLLQKTDGAVFQTFIGYSRVRRLEQEAMMAIAPRKRRNPAHAGLASVWNRFNISLYCEGALRGRMGAFTGTTGRRRGYEIYVM